VAYPAKQSKMLRRLRLPIYRPNILSRMWAAVAICDFCPYALAPSMIDVSSFDSAIAKAITISAALTPA